MHTKAPPLQLQESAAFTPPEFWTEPQFWQENAARMQKQKAVFDRKLQEQEEKNRLVVKENAKIAKNIMKLAHNLLCCLVLTAILLRFV